MGTWHLEVFKMAIYMIFPVAIFHIFNQPAYFEDWVTKKKRELYPPENLGYREIIEQAILNYQEREDQKRLRALKDLEALKTLEDHKEMKTSQNLNPSK